MRSCVVTRTCPTSAPSPRPSAAALRPQRLRRDAARPVRVRREADGGQLHDRGPQQRLLQGRCPRATMASVTAYREAMAGFAADGARWTSGTPIWTRTRSMASHPGSRRRRRARQARKGAKGKAKSAKPTRPRNGRRRPLDKAAKTAEKTLHKAHSRDSLQALSKLAEQVDGKYRIVSHPPIVVPLREVTATYGIVRRTRLEPDPPGPVPRVPRHAPGRPATPAGALPSSSTWLARSSASAASAPGPSSSCCRDATRRTRCSCRSRRPPHRCWRSTCRRAATRSPANGWCRDSG